MRPRNRAASSNPAQRLYTILQRHSEIAASSPSASYAAIWAAVFDVEQSELPTYLSSAFGLIAEIERCVDVLDQDHPRPTFAHHKLEWTHAFVPQSSSWVQAVQGGRPDEGALIALGNLASIPAASLPEGLVPSDEDQRTIRTMVEELIAAVVADHRLDADLADLIVRRLHDITWALDTWRSRGRMGWLLPQISSWSRRLECRRPYRQTRRRKAQNPPGCELFSRRL